ncbi:hypothetical protein DFH06DRAFT_1118539 [Mycena polygramma]|nr:hypothetical protein DFH06DRAFT_1313245 [Mycena polygramma]KAJ7684885.1 hypothetical protein DFH06DRAFT_1118539 [Mycena polygramma]
MTHNYSPAPAAASTAAGAGSPAHVHQVNAALAALGNAVDDLTFSANALVTSPISDMGNAVTAVVAAADVVGHAQANLFAAFAIAPTAASSPTGTSPGSVPAPAVAPAPAPVPAPAPATALATAVLRSSAPWRAGFLYSVVPYAPLEAVVDNGDKWFAITRGTYVGLTQNSAISLNAVTGVSTGLSEKFTTQAMALAHFNAALASGAIAILA